MKCLPAMLACLVLLACTRETPEQAFADADRRVKQVLDRP